jgi:hypothetical protein
MVTTRPARARGIVIGSLVSGIAKRSTRVRQAGEDTESYTRGSSSSSLDI